MPTIVLHHGLFGFDAIEFGRIRLPYFIGIDSAIAARGHRVIVTRVHPTGGVERRARELKDSIIAQLGDSKDRCVILAHSLGGLDARYMLAKLDMADRVAALVTITTPHRGSPYADWCLKNLGKRLGGLRLMKMLGLDVQAITDLTIDGCCEFNDKIANVPGVRYFSISAARPWNRIPPFAIHSHRVITAVEGDNDGLVSVKSSTWAEHLGVWPADHWHTINHRLVLELREKTGDISPYYVKLLDTIGAVE
jgi:triacylglycerol lipase